MAEKPAILRCSSLGAVPHGFCEVIKDERQPDPAWLVPGGHLVLLNQVHSGDAICVDAPLPESDRPQVDGMATATPGLVLGIVTADCAPVLFNDRNAGVIGAAHAGWRGAIGGVLEATIAKMEALGASRDNISACIGPAIAQASYEVDEAFRAKFVQQDSKNALFFGAGKEGHFHFDLPAFVARQLANAGIAKIHDLAEDTYSQSARFHSFRRATHRGEPTYGRQFSIIGLPK